MKLPYRKPRRAAGNFKAFQTVAVSGLSMLRHSSSVIRQRNSEDEDETENEEDKFWRPYRESNPGYLREREVS
jgi:hypothetical protein